MGHRQRVGAHHREKDGKYYFYFSGHNTTLDRKTIGVAVADNPEGPFVAQPTAMILNNEAVTSGQAIDPAAFIDPETGKYYLFWGNGKPVYAELVRRHGVDQGGDHKAISGLNDFREGSFVDYRDGLYHMTYSIDDTGSENYASATPQRPDRRSVDLPRGDPAEGRLAGHPRDGSRLDPQRAGNRRLVHRVPPLRDAGRRWHITARRRSTS